MTNPPKSNTYPELYLAALRKHVKQGSRVNVNAPRTLGAKAVKLGLETLEVATIHQEALLKVALPGNTFPIDRKTVRLAGAFFLGVITPMEEFHRSSRAENARLKEAIGAMDERTGALAASNAGLKLEISQRLTAEETLRTSEATSSQLLA